MFAVRSNCWIFQYHAGWGEVVLTPYTQIIGGAVVSNIKVLKIFYDTSVKNAGIAAMTCT